MLMGDGCRHSHVAVLSVLLSVTCYLFLAEVVAECSQSLGSTFVRGLPSQAIGCGTCSDNSSKFTERKAGADWNRAFTALQHGPYACKSVS